MRTVSVAEARQKLRSLLDHVTEGNEVIVLRRGKEIARIVPPPAPRPRRLPSLATLRASVRLRGGPLSRTVIRARRGERY
jgi:prevent-host-death family protein